MCWTRVFVLSMLTALLVLTISSVVDSAAVRNEATEDEPIAQEQDVFEPEPDTPKSRGRRSVEYYRALQAERHRREPDRQRYHEQLRRDYEHYLEESRHARDRPTENQWRQHQWSLLYHSGYSPYYSPYYSSYYHWYH